MVTTVANSTHTFGFRDAAAWAATRLAVYIGAVLVSVTLLVVAAGIYSLTVPAPIVEIAPPPPLPATPPTPVETPKGDKLFVPAGPGYGGAMVSADPGKSRKVAAFAASEVLGIKIYGPDKTEIGEVTELVMSRKGQADGFIIGYGTSWRKKRYVFIPFESVAFQNKDGTPVSLTIPYTLDDLLKLPVTKTVP